MGLMKVIPHRMQIPSIAMFIPSSVLEPSWVVGEKLVGARVRGYAVTSLPCELP